MATNGAVQPLVPEVGARVFFQNARTQTAELATVTAVETPLGDGTVIVSIERDLGGTAKLPLAALSRWHPQN